MKRIFIKLIFVILVSGCNIKYSAFPNDLIYYGKPIHPACITKACFGDGSRFWLVPLETCVYDQTEALVDEGLIKEIDSKVSYDLGNESVRYYQRYSIVGDDRTKKYPKRREDSYEYVGTYKDKHVVIQKNNDTSGAGEFSSLTVIKRAEDGILNDGEITHGIAYAGIVTGASLKGSILRYEQMVSANAMMRELTGNEPFDEYSYVHARYPTDVFLIYEMDLSSDPKNGKYNSWPIGVKIDVGSGYINNHVLAGVSSPTRMSCKGKFYYDLFKCTDEGKKILSIDEARDCVSSILDCVDSKKRGSD